jgi:toluene monooxygenase system ferredoxin subunit
VIETGIRWVDVGGADDLWEGDAEGLQVEGEEVLLACMPGDEIRAYQGTCPHQQQSLAEGDMDEHVLTCPGHLWEFDLRTGRGVNPSGCQLFTYEIKREGDRILLGVPTDGRRRHNRCTA